MHGLVNRALQNFVTDTYGSQAWQAIATAARIDPPWFEAMLTYEDAVTDRVLAAAAGHLSKAVDAILEDLGTYLVSHPNVTAPRRLLRFAGPTFEEFLHSLEDLPDRVRLAVPELVLPDIEVSESAPGKLDVVTGAMIPGYVHVLAGLVRAMADEYGALATIETIESSGDTDRLLVDLHVQGFQRGREFRLGEGVT
ncbi:MAG: heme NO-binding domain-containing protein [Pseudomonadota bacterium]